MMKGAASVLILVLLSAAAASGAVTLTHCVNDCAGVNNGDYNSCHGCAEFVTCSEGTMTKTPCAESTFFDSDKGKCDWTSNTCTVGYPVRVWTVIETNSTNDPTTKSDPTAVQTTTAQTTSGRTSRTTSQSISRETQTPAPQTGNSGTSSSTSSPYIQSNFSDTHTPTSQSGADKTSGSENSRTVSSIVPHVQTTETQAAAGSHTSVPTIQPPSTPTTTAQTPDSQADVNICRYFRVQYQTIPCVSEDQALAIVAARTKVECAIICNRTTKCWHFQHSEWQCWLYEMTSPPCHVDVYRYDG